MPDLVTVCFSAGFAALTSLGVQTYFSMRAARVDLVNDFIKDLEEIEDRAVEYWHTTAALPAEDPKRAIDAAYLRGKLHAARCFRRVAQKCLEEDFGKFDELDRLLFRTATGGDFETDRAVQDLKRADVVLTTCAELRAILRVSRRKAFWAR